MENQPPDGEPDYRVTMAAERTYLSYIRTSLALLAAGVAVVGVFPDAGYEGLRRAAGVVLVALGILVAVTARRRRRDIDKAVRGGMALPGNPAELLLAVGLVLVGAIALVLVLLA